MSFHPADQWGHTVTVSDAASVALSNRALSNDDCASRISSPGYVYDAHSTPPCKTRDIYDASPTTPCKTPPCKKVKVDTSTFDSATKDSLLRVPPRLQDPWVIRAERTVSNGQSCTLVRYHSRGSYVATIPFSSADKVITGFVTNGGKLYGVKWRTSKFNKQISRFMRGWFRETNPPPPPHFEMGFKNNRVRSQYSRKSPLFKGQHTPKQRDIGHDFAGMPCIYVFLTDWPFANT